MRLGNGMNRLHVIATMILLGATLLCGVLWADARRDLSRLRGEIHRPTDADFEARAILAEATYQRATVSTIRRLLFPLTVELSDRICVELRSHWGVTHGGTVYCFDKKTKRIVERFEPSV